MAHRAQSGASLINEKLTDIEHESVEADSELILGLQFN